MGHKSIAVVLWTSLAVALMLVTTILLLAAHSSKALPSFSSSAKSITPPPLRLREDGTFQISIFEDLHFGEAEHLPWGPHQDLKSTAVMNTILDIERPDLVVLNGDLITGENTFSHNSTHYLDAIVAPLLHRGIPWASTYGNHDSDINLSRAALFARERSRWPKDSFTRSMVPGDADEVGVTNYYIPVHGSDTPTKHDASASAPAFVLWFFDSRGGNTYQPNASSTAPLENWVHQSVVQWFEGTRDKLRGENDGQVLPSLAFMHIPVSAFLDAQVRGVGARTEPGVNDDVPLAAQGGAVAAQGSGKGREQVKERQDAQLVRALCETEGLGAVFSGHDHGDSWCARWDGSLDEGKTTGEDGLNLCFGQRSGYGGYGSWIRGSRQVLLRKDSEDVETWVRLEDGSQSGRVVLNGTYGRDLYPAVENRKTHLDDMK